MRGSSVMYMQWGVLGVRDRVMYHVLLAYIDRGFTWKEAAESLSLRIQLKAYDCIGVWIAVLFITKYRTGI